MADATQVALSLSSALACPVKVAAGHRAGVAELRHRDYSVVVVDDCMAEANPAATDTMFCSAKPALRKRGPAASRNGSRAL